MTKVLTLGLVAIAFVLAGAIALNAQLTFQVDELSSRLDRSASSLDQALSKLSRVEEEVRLLKAEPSSRIPNATFPGVVTKGGEPSAILPASLAELYDNAKESVVSIRVITRIGTFVSSGAGSGFIYSQEGYIITNFHVVMGSISTEVVFYDGEAVKSELIGQDPYSDLAVLKIETKRNLKDLKLGDSSKIRVGDPVVAIGNPFGLSGSLTFGVVSQLGRTLDTVTEPGYKITNVVQINAAVNPGNSGGPLLNLNGEVVGITTAIASTTGQSAGIGFVIPSNTVRREVKDLITKGTYDHSFLGTSSLDMTSSLARALGLNYTKGVLITAVVAHGPADKAGLRGGNRMVRIGGSSIPAGGDLIIKVDGISIRNGDDLSFYLEEMTKPGGAINVTVIRDGKEIVVKVTLGARPPPQLG